MKLCTAASIVSSLFVLALAFSQAKAQLPGTDAPSAISACGPWSTHFDVTYDKSQPPPTQVPPGKVLVYLFENIPRYTLHNVTVRVGVDGKWVGATLNESYLSFLADPGLHHLCVQAHGGGLTPVQEGIAVHQLNARAGRTYYFRTRISQPQGSATTLLDAVDDDQAQLLLQTSAHATSHSK